MALIIWGILTAALVLIVYLRHSPAPAVKSFPRVQNAELVRVLLSLEEESLNELFKLYREEFGPSAARYARQTYQKWKAGEVRPNRQTFNRLLIHLPQVMSFELKCEILRKLREAYGSKDSYRLTVYTDDWQDTLPPLLTAVINKSYTAELPKPVAERLRWLSGNDMQAARVILAESQAREGRHAAERVRQDISQIEELLARAGGRKKITHTLKFPYGIVTLKVKRRQPW